MRFRDGAVDGSPYSHPVGFRRDERLKQLSADFLRDARHAVINGDLTSSLSRYSIMIVSHRAGIAFAAGSTHEGSMLAVFLLASVVHVLRVSAFSVQIHSFYESAPSFLSIFYGAARIFLKSLYSKDSK